MSKSFNLAQRIIALKPGKSFVVTGDRQRQDVCRAVKVLRDAGVITWDVITRETEPKKFTVTRMLP